MRLLESVLDVFLPRVCLVCGRRLFRNESHLCLHCIADMPLTHFWERTHNLMADKFNDVINARGGGDGEMYAYACALFFFKPDSPYRDILYDIKYKGNIAAGKHLGKMLGAKMASADMFSDVDAVVPVPLHWRRKWKRGYNQAEIIATGVAEAMGLPVRTDLLKRVKYTRTQTRLDVAGKMENVRNAFDAGSDGREELKHILIVDDVLTTGSTIYECFRSLRAVFPPPVRISVATLGFVGGA